MSNLLEQASLVMIPSGYKEDIVYSVIPTSGAGDLTFTRASNGTRIDSNGNVEVVPWNLCDYSEDQTQWTSQNETTVIANSTIAPNGTITADTITPSTVNDDHYRGIILSQQVGALTAFIYVKPNGYNFFDWGIYNSSQYIVRATFDLVNLTYTFTNAGTATIESVGNGWLKCGISGTNASLTTMSLYYRSRPTGGTGAFAGNGTSGAFVWGAQLNIGSTAKPYFPTTDRLNVPRLTYQNGGGGCPSLLLEKQSTNYARNWNLTAAIWSKNSANVTANAGTSPDGTNNAYLIYPSTSGTDRFIYDDQGSAGYSTNTNYTTTVFAKAAGLNWAYIRFEDKSNISSYVYFNLATGVVGSTTGSVTIVSKTIEAMGNGWYRLRVTANMGTGTGGNNNVLFGVADGDGSTYATASGTNGVLFYGPQGEQSDYPTSPIPTSGSSATRVADACFKTGISSLFGTNQGTFFIDFIYYGSEQFSYLFDVTDSANANRFLMYDSNGSGLYYFYDSGYSQITTYQFTKGQRYKIAVKYNSSGTIWYVNGVLSATGTVSFAHQMSQIYLGIRYSITDNTGMTVNESIVFPTALSTTELASLTTI